LLFYFWLFYFLLHCFWLFDHMLFYFTTWKIFITKQNHNKMKDLHKMMLRESSNLLIFTIHINPMIVACNHTCNGGLVPHGQQA
jgi:hypothetical protein